MTNATRRLCSTVSVRNGDDPAGTGTPFHRYLTVEIPPPWKEDIAASAHFPPGLWDRIQRAYNAGVIDKFTGLLPDPEYSREGHVRALIMSRPEAPFAAFDKSEYLLPGGKLLSFVEALAEGVEGLAPFEDYREDTARVRDVLVCTHGSNDACCGKFGYPVYDRLRSHAANSGGSLRVWRTSHIGGHRFAATLIDLPEGRYWGHLDANSAERVLLRDVEPAELEENCRGWAGMRSNFEQIAERAILAREGWKWTGYLKSSRLLDHDEATDRAEVRVEYAPPDGGVSGVYEATVEAAGSAMTLLKSGSEPLQEIPQYRVSRLEKVG